MQVLWQNAINAYLAGGIDNLGCKILTFVFDDAAEGVINGRVVALYKVTFDKLNRERGLACICNGQLGKL